MAHNRYTSVSNDHDEEESSLYPSSKSLFKVPASGGDWGLKSASVISLFLLGLGCAIGHDRFYAWKDGKLAWHQEWTIRVGNGLAYLASFSLAAVGGISRDQWLWLTLRKKYLTVGGIDAMFGVSSSVLCFFNLDILQRAKVSTAMALVRWFFPLLTIFAPSSISVVQRHYDTELNCTVPTLDFRYHADPNRMATDWILGDGLYLSLNTPNASTTYSEPEAMGFSLLTVPAFSGQTTTGGPNPFGEVLCGKDNVTCTYSIQFEGPAVNCTEPGYPIDDPSAPWYDSGYDFSQCNSTQEEGVLPMFVAEMNKTDSTFWVLESVRGDTGSRTACREVHGYICQSSVANYIVEQSFFGDQYWEPTITVDILYPVMDSREDVMRSRPPYYQNYCNIPNWILFDVLYELLGGSQNLTFTSSSVETDAKFQKPTHSGIINFKTKADGTPLMNSSYSPIYPLGQAIETMTQKMVVSLLSYQDSSYYNQTQIECYRGEYFGVYEYKSRELLIAYAVSIGVSGILAVLGTIALVRNGAGSDVSFSTILRTTRNPALDKKVEESLLNEKSTLPGLKLKCEKLDGSWKFLAEGAQNEK